MKTIKTKILFFGSVVLFLASLAAVIYYICGPARGFFHADCSDSLYWAQASIESGSLIADNYRYAAILPFSANLWMIPVVKIFGFTMTAQTISMVIFALLYSLSLLWVLRSLKLSWTFSLSGSAFLLMLFSASTKMREIMWEHVIYYSLSLLLLNCLLALALKTISAYKIYKLRGKKLGLVLYIVALLLLSLCTSINGLPVIVMTTLPLFMGLMLELWLDSDSKLLRGEGRLRLLTSGGIAICSVLGFVLLKLLSRGVVADYTNLYSKFSSIGAWADNIMRLPEHFISLLGFRDGRVDFLSLDGIINLLAIAMFILLMLIPFAALFFYKRLRCRETKLMLLVYFSLFALMMFMFICGNISGSSWRIVPLVGVSALCSLCVLRELITHIKDKRRDKKRGTMLRTPVTVAVLIITVFSVFSASSFYGIVTTDPDYGRNNTVHRLTDTLIEHELKYGYATFWNSNAITLLSDSKVLCREILADSDGAKTDYYQSSFDWYEPQDGVDEYFVLLSDAEYARVRFTKTWRQWEAKQLIKTINDVDGYKIFVFDGYLEGIK